MIIANLNRLLFGTLRRQLIIGVAAVHALMMALFIVDLTRRQEEFLLDRQAEQATALAHSLATSASDWLAAHDISGLQELAESQRRYPELQFAMLLDNRGQVLAHTDRSRLGQYVRDLPDQVRQTTVSRSPSLVDVIVPATLADRHVGWARVGIGQHLAGRKLAEITRNGVIYALAAILTGSLLAWFMGRRLTSRLYAVRSVMDEVRTGNNLARSRLSGTDEAADLAAGFNTMLDTMAELNEELQGSEERFRSIFENSPVSIWEEDFSGVKALLDGLKTEGVTDIEHYFDQHPETVRRCAELVKVVEVNWAALALHGAKTKEELIAGLVNTFTPESFDTFRQELVCLWNGETDMERDAVVKTLAGESRFVTVYFSVCPGYEENLAKVLVSLADITKRKLTEESLHRSEEALRIREGMLKESQRVGQVGSWDWDAVNDVIWWSDEYYRIYGFDPGTPPPIYLDHLRAYMPESAARLDAAVKRAMEGGEPYELDLELANPTPTTRWVVARCEVKRDETGAIVGLCGTAHNITERKLAELSLKTLNEELENRVKERTAELEEKNAELERTNRLFVGRELRMVELKERIRELEIQSGKTGEQRARE